MGQLHQLRLHYSRLDHLIEKLDIMHIYESKMYLDFQAIWETDPWRIKDCEGKNKKELSFSIVGKTK
jgi:hypothetical protein